jgi:hypothetical protein
VSIATGRGKLRNAPKATAGRQNVARRDVPIPAVSRCSISRCANAVTIVFYFLYVM